MHIFTSLFSILETILAHGGYWIIFLASALEAAPLVGSFVPGHALIILAGLFARIGVLNVYTVIWVSAAGAIIGDVAGYTLGKKYGFDFLVRFGKYFFLREEHLEKARKVMDKHTGKALIIGRFNPVTRALTPFLAGASDLHPYKFWTYNIIGGICWAVVSVLVGYVFGASYEVISKYIGKFIFIATILSLLIIWAYNFINSRRHIFAKYHLYTLIVNIGALYIFFKTIQDSFGNESSLAQLDVWVNLKMLAHESAGLTSFMYVITNVFSPANLVLLSGILIIYLVYKKRWHYVFLSSVSLLGGGVLSGLIKVLVARSRPENAYEMLSDYSFPSGHATISIIFCCLFMYISVTEIRNKYLKEFVGTLCIFCFLLTGISRVYLRVHWLSDVVAGFSLGLFWLSLVILFTKFAHSVVEPKLQKKSR